MNRYLGRVLVVVLMLSTLAGCTPARPLSFAQAAAPAATPTTLPTATTTPTSTPTALPTSTATAAPTMPPLPPTATPTNTPAPTVTPTNTPVPTATPSAPTKADVVMRAQTNKPYVAITIDDFFTFSNYEQQEGVRLLEAANALHAPLTVCPTGYALEAYNMAAPEQLVRLRELITQGSHEVCNHTLSHPFLAQLDREAQLDEIRAGNDLIAQHLEHPVSPYLRPPFGDYNDDTRLAAAEAGLPTIVTWTIDSGDWVDPPPSVDTIVAQTAHAQPGDILLMHANRAVSAEALPRIIEHLRARGLEPVTLSTLLASGTPVLVDEQTDR